MEKLKFYPSTSYYSQGYVSKTPISHFLQVGSSYCTEHLSSLWVTTWKFHYIAKLHRGSVPSFFLILMGKRSMQRQQMWGFWKLTTEKGGSDSMSCATSDHLCSQGGNLRSTALLMWRNGWLLGGEFSTYSFVRFSCWKWEGRRRLMMMLEPTPVALPLKIGWLNWSESTPRTQDIHLQFSLPSCSLIQMFVL